LPQSAKDSLEKAIELGEAAAVEFLKHTIEVPFHLLSMIVIEIREVCI